MAIFNKCCFCISLEASGVIQGWIGVGVSFLSVAFSIIVLCNFQIIAKLIEDDPRIVAMGETKAVAGIFFLITMGIIITTSIINLVTSALLIMGAIQRNRFLLLPWIITVGIYVLLHIFSAISILVLLFTRAIFSSDLDFLIYLIVLTSPLPLYLWLTIVSLFQKFHQEEKTLPSDQMRKTSSVNHPPLLEP